MSEPSQEADAPGDERGIRIELGEGPTVLVTFGGLATEMGVPMFEFARMTSELPCHRVYCRDHDRVWYHHGVVGAGRSFAAFVDELARSLRELSPGRVVGVGSSAGGYAALVVGALLEFDRIIAFAPQTFVDPRRRALIGDTRWPTSTERLAASDWLDSRYDDAAEVLERNGGVRQADLYFPSASVVDRFHAHHVAGCPGVELHAVATDDHNIPKLLKKQGRLAELINAAVVVPGDADRLAS